MTFKYLFDKIIVMLTILYTTFRAEFPRLVYSIYLPNVCHMWILAMLQEWSTFVICVFLEDIRQNVSHFLGTANIYLSITTCQVCQLLELNIGKFDNQCMYLVT